MSAELKSSDFSMPKPLSFYCCIRSIGSCVLLTLPLLSFGLPTPYHPSQLLNLPNLPPFLPRTPEGLTHSNQLPIVVPLSPKNPNILPLQSAVLLALHKNPNLKVAFNNRKLQRYDLLVAKEAFLPQFSLTSSLSYNRYDTDNTVRINGHDAPGGSSASSQNTSGEIGPAVSWKLPLGTELSADWQYNPSKQTGSTPGIGSDLDSNTWSVSLTQPLIKHFGFAVNEVNLHNAETNQQIDDLQLQQQVATTISQVVTDYYAVVQAKLTVAIARQTLEQSQHTLFNRKQKYKTGQLAGIDITQAKMDITSQQQSLASAEESFNTARTTLLNDLGLPGNTVFKVDTETPITQIRTTLEQSLQLAKQHNRDLKIALLQHKISERNLLTSENANRWELDLKLSRSHTRASTIYDNPQINPNSNDLVTSTSVSLDLTIPLNRVTIDQQKLSAAVAVENDQINLQNARRTLLSSVTTAVQNLKTQWSQLGMSQANLVLAQKNYRAAQIKFNYGRIDAFTLSQQQQQLVQAKNNVVTAKISYLTQAINYEKLMGILLQQWHIKLEAKNHA